MDNLSRFKPLVAFALCLMFVSSVSAQNASQKKTLVVNGRAADGVVAQIDGRSYVDLEAFARAMSATVSFEPGRVVLTIPAAEAGANSESATPRLSKDFAIAGISQLAAMSEWKGAIASAIRSGVASGMWLGPALQDHRARAEESLSKASLAAKNESDQKALQLLKNEFANLGEWDSNTQAAIQALNGEKAVDPNAAQNDPLLQKITECSRFLNTMLVNGEFADGPSCH
ncbi:MAG: hypothetical protein WCA92_03600 [Terriglobales bacterium]|jgi:hypothetical protein